MIRNDHRNGSAAVGHRRRVLLGLLATTAIALQMLSLAPVAAQEFPSSDIRLLITSPAGGQTDALGRVVGEGMAQVLKGNIVVENISGAGGSLAAATVAQAQPDGYTILLGTIGTQVVNPLIAKDLPYSADQLEPVALLATSAAIFVANPAFEGNSIGDLIKMAKEKPGEIQYSTNGLGTSGHLAAEMLESMAGIDMVPIHYRGSAPATVDLLGGQIMVGVDGLPGQLENVRAGKLKALAMSDSQRDPLAPDIATVAETVPGFEVTAWYGLYVPKGTPEDVVNALNAAANTALQSDSVKKRLNDMGFRLQGGSAADFAKFQADENAKWTPVIQKAGIKAE